MTSPLKGSALAALAGVLVTFALLVAAALKDGHFSHQLVLVADVRFDWRRIELPVHDTIMFPPLHVVEGVRIHFVLRRVYAPEQAARELEGMRQFSLRPKLGRLFLLDDPLLSELSRGFNLSAYLGARSEEDIAWALVRASDLADSKKGLLEFRCNEGSFEAGQFIDLATGAAFGELADVSALRSRVPKERDRDLAHVLLPVRGLSNTTQYVPSPRELDRYYFDEDRFLMLFTSPRYAEWPRNGLVLSAAGVALYWLIRWWPGVVGLLSRSVQGCRKLAASVDSFMTRPPSKS